MQPVDLPSRPERRGFLVRLGALLAGALGALVPLGAGLATFFDPVRRKSAAGGFVKVAMLHALPEDGAPRRFPVIADRADAWNKFPAVPVGAVYLRRVAGKVEALSVECPHAGCAVEFRAGANAFLCPCHDSAFRLDGSLADRRSPSPRGMDALEVEVRGGAEVWVKFQKFEAGKAHKVPLA